LTVLFKGLKVLAGVIRLHCAYHVTVFYSSAIKITLDRVLCLSTHK